MNLVFIDETSTAKIQNSFGVCAVLVNSTKYPTIVRRFHKLLDAYGWDTNTEFKGQWIFASKKGDDGVSVAKRVEITDAIVGLCAAKSNSRLKVAFRHNQDGCNGPNYLHLLGQTLRALPLCRDARQGKNLTAVFLDRPSQCRISAATDLVRRTITARGCLLLEETCIIDSRVQNVGIAMADILGYVCMAQRGYADFESFGGLFDTTPDARKKVAIGRWYDGLMSVDVKESILSGPAS